jgi:hypothetical protein
MESRSSRDSRAMDGRAAEEYASGSCLEANVTGTKAAAIGVWTMSKTSRVCRWHRAQPVPAPPKPTAAVRADVDRLVARATELDSLWPWKAASPEIDRVVRHGKAVAPLLVALLAVAPTNRNRRWPTGASSRTRAWPSAHLEDFRGVRSRLLQPDFAGSQQRRETVLGGENVGTDESATGQASAECACRRRADRLPSKPIVDTVIPARPASVVP